eukprot:scaffold88400_cov57-Attheya_sp.AAC.3
MIVNDDERYEPHRRYATTRTMDEEEEEDNGQWTNGNIYMRRYATVTTRTRTRTPSITVGMVRPSLP